jgi:hypothetical protein
MAVDGFVIPGQGDLKPASEAYRSGTWQAACHRLGAYALESINLAASYAVRGPAVQTQQFAQCLHGGIASMGTPWTKHRQIIEGQRL